MSVKSVRAICAAIMLVMLAGLQSVATLARPTPPCAGVPVPDYPSVGQSPNVMLWSSSDLAGWTPPTCTPWPAGAASLVTALSGSFHLDGGINAVKTKIGSISSLLEVRYWSVTDKAWKNMFVHATALDGPSLEKPRSDFAAAELRAGTTLYFMAADNRSGHETVSRLHIIAMDEEHFVIETENVTPLRWTFLTYAAPGSFQTWYFLNRNPGNNWRFYSLTRVLYASALFGKIVPDRSYINRAVAMYRYFSNEPTDGSPPAAP